MQDMNQTFDQSHMDDDADMVFGSGPEKIAVDAARFFCLAFAFIVPNVLLINHVWGF